MDAEERAVAAAKELFLEELPTIERAIRFACRRGSLHDADAEDFGSYVKVKLIDADYAALRGFEGRSSFAAFIGVVVQRLLLDYRIHLWGRWHASAEAKRLGERAVAVESMLLRDGRTIDEVIAPLQRRWPELTRAGIEDIARRLPRRAPRPYMTSLDDATREPGVDGRVDRAVLEREQVARSARLAAAVREAMRRLPDDERTIVRLRFEGGMSVAEIARSLGVEQKPLYRRVTHALRNLRKMLEQAGYDESDAEAVLAMRPELDFGFDAGNAAGGPSKISGPSDAEGEGA